MRNRILFKDEEISREIERRIGNRRMKAGDRLPSERQLAEEFGVQRGTVRCALEILLKKGTIVKIPRRGHFVAQKRVEIGLNNLHAIKRELESIGRNSRNLLLIYETVSIDKRLAEILQMPEGTLCYHILRIRYDSEKPMSLERSYLIADYVPNLRREDVTSRSPASIMRQKYGIILTDAYQRITQVYADDMESELLRINKEEPLIKYEGMMHDRKGRLIEYFDNVILPDSIEFHIREYA